MRCVCNPENLMQDTCQLGMPELKARQPCIGFSELAAARKHETWSKIVQRYQVMHARKPAEEQAGACCSAPARQTRKHDARELWPVHGHRGSCIGFPAL